MPNPTTFEKIKGLALSAVELKSMTNWADPVIEEFLSILRALSTISTIMDGLIDKLEDGTAQGQLAFWDDTLKRWVHTETTEIIWDDVNKRIGLNVAAPTERLHVDGNILTTGSISTQGRIKNITRVTTSPYTVVATDEILMVDTDAIIITILLPVGTDGRVLEVINCGSSKNRVTITPNGVELLFGVNNSEYAYDAESIVMAYDLTEGWF